MKKATIVALACVNVVLLAALVLGAMQTPAYGQVVGGGRNYMMITGHISDDYDALYVIDLARRRMIGLKFDRTDKELVGIRGRELREDFNRREQR